jgi:hypothetical protein
VIDLVWNFLTVHVDWRLWLILFGLAVVGLSILHKTVGLQSSLVWAVGAAGVLLVLLAKATQKGYRLREADADAANKKAVDEFNKVQTEIDKKPIDQVDRDNEKWLRP